MFWILAELFSPSYPTHAVLIRLISSISTTTLTLAVMGITIGKLKEYKEVLLLFPRGSKLIAGLLTFCSGCGDAIQMGSHCGMQPN